MLHPVIRIRSAFFAALIFSSLLSAERPDDSLAEYAGTRVLPKLGDLVLVYPAGSGAQAALNQLSAQRRADYIRDQFGVDVSVATDTNLTDAQRSGHLMITGWDNALIRSGPLAPFLVSDGSNGRTFVETIDVGPGEDLMFSVASPVDPTKRWTFWSRIDLELDRFSVLPMNGSDWAVYRGYELTAQGMLKDRTVWPPVANPFAMAETPDFRERYPVQARSEHYAIRYPRGLLLEGERDEILRAREEALAMASTALGEPDPPMQIDLFIYPTATIKFEETSVPDEVHSLVRSQELHMLTPYARTPNPHEELHLVARRMMGASYHTALYEGLALALGEREPGGGREVYAAAIVDHEGSPSIDQLLDEARLRRVGNGGLAYPAGSLLVAWILERGGTELLEKVYTALPLTEELLAEKMGLESGMATRQFGEWLRDLSEDGRETLRFEEARAEAGALRKRGDGDGAIASLRRALAIRPGDVDTLYRLALVEMNGEGLEDAEKHLDEIIAQGPDLPAGAQRYVIFGHYMRGRVYEKSGRPDAARVEFERVLSLPDGSNSHQMARDALHELSERSEAPTADGS
jgi:tetratricopeptide (TPR) repeat protein